MGFLSPNPPKPVPPANSPLLAKDTPNALPDQPFGAGSLIATSPSGLKRKATTERTSLIGGY